MNSLSKLSELFKKRYSMDHAGLMDYSRYSDQARKRQMFMYLAMTYYPEISSSKIGKFMARDHTTVLYGWKTIGKKRMEDHKLDVELRKLELELGVV